MWFFYQYLICCAWKMRRRDTKAWQEGTGGDVKKLTEHSMTTWNRTRWWWTSNEHLMEGETLLMMAGMTMVEWERVLRKRMSTKIRICSTICWLNILIPPKKLCQTFFPQQTTFLKAQKEGCRLNRIKIWKWDSMVKNGNMWGTLFLGGQPAGTQQGDFCVTWKGGGALDNRGHCAAAL